MTAPTRPTMALKKGCSTRAAGEGGGGGFRTVEVHQETVSQPPSLSSPALDPQPLTITQATMVHSRT